MKFLTQIDLNHLAPKSLAIENSTTGSYEVSGNAVRLGAIYYETGSNKLKYNTSTSGSGTWLQIADTTAYTVLTLGVTSPILNTGSSSNPVIAIQAASGSQNGYFSSANYTTLNAAASINTASTLVIRDGSGNFAAGQITATKVTGLTAPTAASDAVNKTYADNIASGLRDFKESVVCTTTANVSIASPGSTFDSITLSSTYDIGSRVLLKDQTTSSQNGIYIWNGSATPMTRSSDANSSIQDQTYKAATATTANGGTSGTYAVNDVLTVVGGTLFSGSATTFTVSSVTGAQVNVVAVTNVGSYTVIPSNPVATTGGGGTGCTLTVIWNIDTSTHASTQFGPGTFVMVEEGTTYADTGWVCTSDDHASNFVLGTSNCTLIMFSGANTLTAGAGLTVSGRTFAVVTDSRGAGTATTAIVSNEVRIAAAWVGQTTLTTLGTITTGTWNGTIVGPVYGGTGFGSYAVGDILYADTTTSLAKLADVATGNVLISGGVTTAPSWGKVGLTTHVSGTLPIANGGTNSNASLNGNRVMVSNNGATAITEFGALTNGQIIIGSTGATPVGTTLTAGANAGVTIANGAGSITLTTVQDIRVSASPTFTALSLSATSNQIIFQSAGVTGTMTWTPTSSGKTLTIPDLTGTVMTTNGGQTVTSGVWNGTTIAVANGGTGATTFTANGVLYGNTTSAVQVTAQGGTNSVLTANAGAPSFSNSPTVSALTLTNVAASGGATTLTVTPGAHTAVVAEVIDVNFAAHTQTLTGGYATQRNVVFAQPTLSGAFTITDSATVAIVGAPIAAGSATLTRKYALWVQADDVWFAGLIKAGSSRIAITNAAGNLDMTQGTGVLPPANGGTGVANASNITIGGAVTFSGAFTTTLTVTATTSVTLPTAGTLSTLAGAETFTNKVSYNGLIITSNTGVVTTGTWNATVINPVYGGTGIANASGSTITLGAAITFTGANAQTFATAGTGTITLPNAASTLATLALTETFTNKTLTTPKINTSILDTNGNTMIAFTATASSVNYFTLTNAATATTAAVLLSGTGSSSAIDVQVVPKGSTAEAATTGSLISGGIIGWNDGAAAIPTLQVARRWTFALHTATKMRDNTSVPAMSTSMVINHQFNCQYVIVQIIEISSGLVQFCDVTCTSNNSITLVFAAAPTTNTLEVTIVG